MKEIVIISGKGGTGKTMITGALSALIQNKVITDCDVDAANLYLILQPETLATNTFVGGKKAFIEQGSCTRCGICRDICRFDAITPDFKIDPILCEGCSFCANACPELAIEMKENISGEWYVSGTRFGPFVHAKLGIGEENSGKLVTILRKEARKIAAEQNADWIITDGSPGIGCPVIASITGASMAVVVTEPSLSGKNDAERVIALAGKFKIPVCLVINKYDLNEELSNEMEGYFKNMGVIVLGKIGFDEAVVNSIVNGKTVIEYARGKTSEKLELIWKRLDSLLS
ncbi:MAG: 4Fe-4S binding protein [Brevinematales bacterium]|nr:4Fe-4S binding protein [Brevinematales bacterium]